MITVNCAFVFIFNVDYYKQLKTLIG